MGSLIERPQNLRSIVTRRSLLPPPAQEASASWEESWAYLFEAYQPAMERYVAALLARFGARGGDREEVRDIVQSYLADCLQKGWLSRDDARIECFRAYLQTQLRRYVHAWLRRADARKRRPEGGVQALLPADLPVGGEDPAAQDLDAGWIEIALSRALAVLGAGNARYYEVITDLLQTGGVGSADLAARMGQTPSQVIMLRHRARKRLAHLFYEALRETVRDDEAFEELCRRLDPMLP